jgi:hypothetical protein
MVLSGEMRATDKKKSVELEPWDAMFYPTLLFITITRLSFSDSASISGKPAKMTTVRLSSPLSQRHHGVFLSRLLFVPKIQLHYKAEK